MTDSPMTHAELLEAFRRLLAADPVLKPPRVLYTGYEPKGSHGRP